MISSKYYYYIRCNQLKSMTMYNASTTIAPTREKEKTATPDKKKRGIPNRNPNPNEKPKPKA